MTHKKPLNTDLFNSLLAVGFNKKEAQVYLALLELGRGTVSQIARKADINRTTGYDILDSLITKDLVRITGKEPKQEYIAESPDKIKRFLEVQIKEKQDQLVSANKLIPQLKSSHRVEDRPRVTFYEGKQGLMDVYEDTLTSSETILAYANVDQNKTTLPSYFPKYYKRRHAKGIPIRAIFPNTPLARERAQFDKDETRESLLVPALKYHLTPEINIYDNKIMIASWKDELGIIIESQEIADAMKKVYELSWAEAKRLDKEERNKNLEKSKEGA